MRYGYIGLGNLGGNLAASLIRKGFDVTVYDRNPALAERHAAMGAKVAASVADLGDGVDHVFTCLPSPAATEAVLAGLLTTLKPGATWIENSTLGRDDILRLGGLADQYQRNLPDADLVQLSALTHTPPPTEAGNVGLPGHLLMLLFTLGLLLGLACYYANRLALIPLSADSKK